MTDPDKMTEAELREALKDAEKAILQYGCDLHYETVFRIAAEDRAKAAYSTAYLAGLQKAAEICKAEMSTAENWDLIRIGLHAAERAILAEASREEEKGKPK